MLESYIVYRHVFPNGKYYYGKTCRSIELRKGKDFMNYRKQPLVWHAIQKYGAANIRTEILFTNICPSLVDEIEESCIRYGKGHASLGGYNASWGGDGFDSDNARKAGAKATTKMISDGTHPWLKKNRGITGRVSEHSESARENHRAVVDDYKDSYSFRKTAKRFGVSPKLIRDIIHDFAPDLINRVSPHQPYTTSSSEKARKDVGKVVEYRKSGLSHQQIADIYGCSRGTIGRILKEQGLVFKKNPMDCPENRRRISKTLKKYHAEKRLKKVDG